MSTKYEATLFRKKFNHLTKEAGSGNGFDP